MILKDGDDDEDDVDNDDREFKIYDGDGRRKRHLKI